MKHRHRFKARIFLAFAWLVSAAGVWALVVTTVVREGRARPVATVLVIAFILVFAGHFARRMARPIEALTEATRRFGAGELSHRVALPIAHGRIGDEIYELSRAWNRMADGIERLVRGQKELLANVSHELRSPLARIRLAVELLPGNEARKRALEADLDELNELIDDVLTASRLEMATFPAHMAEVDGDALLAGLVERARNDELLGDKRVSLEGSIGTIRADATLLRRALWNLLENAGRHGAPPIVVTGSAGERVRITVADGGPGIPAADRERVTEPFVRGNAARTPGGGVGLGLTIARRVAEVHGGTLEIDGARLTLSLPAFTPP
ncbi:MAG TPA: ATP-binding protein [Haliangiales bacterium]|nr:ATP-binding protein [Haliangiales bacterium]